MNLYNGSSISENASRRRRERCNTCNACVPPQDASVGNTKEKPCEQQKDIENCRRKRRREECPPQDASVGNTKEEPCEQQRDTENRRRERRREESLQRKKRREKSSQSADTLVPNIGESDPVSGSASRLTKTQQGQVFQLVQEFQQRLQKLLEPGPEPVDVQPLHAQLADAARTANSESLAEPCKQAAKNGEKPEQAPGQQENPDEPAKKRRRRRRSDRKSDAASASAQLNEEPGEVGGNFLAYPFPEIQRNTTFLDEFLTKSVKKVQRLGKDLWPEVVIHRCSIKALQGIVHDGMYVPSRGKEDCASPNFMMTKRLIYHGARAGKIDDIKCSRDAAQLRLRKQLEQAMEVECFHGPASILLLLAYEGNMEHVKRAKLQDNQNLDEIKGRIVQTTGGKDGSQLAYLPLSRHRRDFKSQRYILHAACYVPGNFGDDEEAKAFYKEAAKRNALKEEQKDTAKSAPVSSSASASNNRICSTVKSSAVQPALEKRGRDAADGIHAALLDVLIREIESHYGDEVRSIDEMSSGSVYRGENRPRRPGKTWLRIVLQEHDGMLVQSFHATNWPSTLSILREKAIKPGDRQDAAGKLGKTGPVAFASKDLTANANYQGPSSIKMGTEEAKICCVLMVSAQEFQNSTNGKYNVAKAWRPMSILIRPWGTDGIDELTSTEVHQPMERFDWAITEDMPDKQTTEHKKTCRTSKPSGEKMVIQEPGTHASCCNKGCHQHVEKLVEDKQQQSIVEKDPDEEMPQNLQHGFTLSRAQWQQGRDGADAAELEAESGQCSQTPFTDEFFRNLQRATEHRGSSDHEEELMEYILTDCIWGDLLYNDRDAETTMPLSRKMENLLEAVHKRRQLLLRDLLTDDSSHYIAYTDMKNMFNNWRKDVGEWMHEHNRKEYEYLKSGDKKSSAHALGKRAFNKYLFQLCGDKFLLQKLIQLPLVRDPNSAAPPMTSQQFATSLAKFISDLHAHYDEPRYKAAAKKTRRCSDEFLHLTKRILRQWTRNRTTKKCYAAELDDLLSQRARLGRKPSRRAILTSRHDVQEGHPHNA